MELLPRTPAGELNLDVVSARFGDQLFRQPLCLARLTGRDCSLVCGNAYEVVQPDLVGAAQRNTWDATNCWKQADLYSFIHLDTYSLGVMFRESACN